MATAALRVQPFNETYGGIGSSPGGIHQRTLSSPSGVDRFFKAFKNPRSASIHVQRNPSPIQSSGGSVSSSFSSLNGAAVAAIPSYRSTRVTSTSSSGGQRKAKIISTTSEMSRQRARTNPSSINGGIGESPIPSNRSRQNSSSSSQQSNSLFSHRQSTSSATKDLAYGGNNVIETHPTGQKQVSTGTKGTLPSIRGYTTFDNARRPLTPLLDPFNRATQQSPNERWQRQGRTLPQLEIDPKQPESYVASLGMAPLVTRPVQGGEPVYIRGGNSDEHYYPMQSFATSPQLPPSSTVSPNQTSPRQQLRPSLRQRSSSWDSYLETRPAVPAQPFDGTTSRAEIDPRRSKSRTQSTSKRRKNSNATSETTFKLGSRFVRYDSCLGFPSYHRPRSSSMSAVDAFHPAPRRDSLQGEGLNPNEMDSRQSRSRTRQRDGDQISSADRRKYERKQHRKLVSARLPSSHHSSIRQVRLPSQPLGLTWVCGSRSAARSPSFYDNFEYSSYPGGKRKRSFSRSKISTPVTGTALPTPVGYESEPESVDQRFFRTSSMRQIPDSPPPVTVDLFDRALRPRSQSLVNLRQAAPDGNNAIIISSPMPNLHSTPDHLIRTPRPAPLPEMDIVGPSRVQERSSYEAFSDPQKRKEALFAALPPPTRRSPTPNMTPAMYPTGHLIATTVAPAYLYDGARSPPMDDLGQFEASRVIIGESHLGSSVGPEKYPVVFGRAYSTNEIAESLEGEIVDAMPAIRETPYSDLSLSGIEQGSANDKSSLGSGSAADSSRVLDLKDENFQNLFFAAPPTKPLPPLPNEFSDRPPSDAHSQYIARGMTSTPSNEGLFEAAAPWRPSSMRTNRISQVSNDGEDERETLLVERLSCSDEARGMQGTSLSVDEHHPISVTRKAGVYDSSGGREQRLLEPLHLRHEWSIDSSKDESENHLTARSAKATSSVLDLHRHLHHQPSFASAQTHISKSSATRTIQPNQYDEQDQSFSSAEHFDLMDMIRRTSRSPIQVSPRRAGSHPEMIAVLSREEKRNSTDDGRSSFIDFDIEQHLRNRLDGPDDAVSFLDDDDSDNEQDTNNAIDGQHVLEPSSNFRGLDGHLRLVVDGAESGNENVAHRHLALDTPPTPLTPASPVSPGSASMSEFLDGYHTKSNQFYRTSNSYSKLGVPPPSPRSRDRTSAVHSASNVSLLSHLSRLTDFPDPPPTTETEKANPMESDLYLSRSVESHGTLRTWKHSSLPTLPSAIVRDDPPSLSASIPPSIDEKRTLLDEPAREARNSFLDLSTSPERTASVSKPFQLRSFLLRG